jgi:hypothetical protein
MYIKVALLLFLTGVIYAKGSDYISLSYDFLDFKNSKQKNVGERFTAHMQKTLKQTKVSIAYEKTDTKTYQPPLKDNLRVDKLYAKVYQKFSQKDSFSLGYIYIDDNIAPTDGTRIYSLGYDRVLYGGFKLGGRVYYGDFNVLNTYQYNVAVKYTQTYNGVLVKLIAEGNYIDIDKCSSSFCENAKDHYSYAVLKGKFNYKKYFLHMGFTVGKRAFSVMRDGFSCSHHAMEFNKTYMAGFGKRFDSFAVKIRYAYLEATELPLNNSGVKVEDIMLRIQYFF